MILRPVMVEPVNATLSTSGCAARAAPPTGPKDGTVLTTPGGKLQTSRHEQVCGTCKENSATRLLR